MAEQAPKKKPTSESPNEAYPQSAKEQQSATRQVAAPSTQGADEPTTNEESMEEEQEEEEVGQQETESDGEEDGKPQPLQPSEITEAAGESGRRAPRRLAKRSMEYPLADMYPEVQLLVDHKRREWNYNDPDIIRALFLEAKTNAVSDWKVCRATFAKRKKPLLEVQETIASKLRRQQLETRQEKLQQEQQREERIHNHRQPDFAEVKLATNLTTQLRYNYTRNNPPVPRHFLAHYERFKKPPFHIHGINSKGCKLDSQPSL